MICLSHKIWRGIKAIARKIASWFGRKEPTTSSE